MSTVLDSFTAKNSKGSFLLFAVLSSFPCIGILIRCLQDPRKASLEFSESPVFLSLVVLFFCGLAAYFWVRFFDRKYKLIIDRNGIWSVETGLIPWEDIVYLFFTHTEKRWGSRERAEFPTTLELNISLHSTIPVCIIDITALDKSEEQILEALQIHAKKYPIQFLEKVMSIDNGTWHSW
jgi:hypothetical protein